MATAIPVSSPTSTMFLPWWSTSLCITTSKVKAVHVRWQQYYWWHTATARPVPSPTSTLFLLWWMADLHTPLVCQISSVICFKLSCGALFLQMSLIVHTLSTRSSAGCEVSKLQCICTAIAHTDPEPASDRLIKQVHTCIYLSHSFGAYPESCHNDTDYRQATR
jgi:hypothetical protein